MGSGPGEGKDVDIHKQPSLNTLTRLGNEEVQKGDLQKALKYFEDAVEKAEKEGDNEVKISCCLNAGACLVSLGQHKKGIVVLEQAIVIIKNVAEVDTQAMEVSADVFYNAATAAHALKEFEKAISYFTAAIELYEKLASKEHTAETLESLASCYRDAKDVEKQISSLARAQRLYNATGDSGREALVGVELAKAYQSARKFDMTKQMLGSAKALSSKLDSLSVKGKLYTQLGLVYTSMGMFDDAIQSFEQALPLVRDVLAFEEASVLQNMGAVYNEKGLYSDAVIYHKKAAALHGRNKNLTSEAKCLCNLAVAETHLGDYEAAKATYISAHKQASTAGNLYLQFQASEGCGSLCIHTLHHEDAVRHLKQALKTLDEIKQDTGMARERVMEKLSDATEALRKDNSDHPKGTTTSSEDQHPPVPLEAQPPVPLDFLSHGCLPGLTDSPLQVRGEKNGTKVAEPVGRLPSPMKKVLPPIRSPKLMLANSRGTDGSTSTGPIADGSTSTGPIADGSTPTGPIADGSTPTRPIAVNKTPLHKNAVPKRRKKELRTVNEVPDAYEQLLNAYVDSIKNDASPASSSDTNLSSSGEHSDHMMGASVFSRHASKGHSRHRQSPAKPPLEAYNGVPASPLSVGEGSLAIGPNARELFTTGTTVVEKEQKRGKQRFQVQTEIVPVGTEAHPPHPDARGQALHTSQSKVCLIL